MLVHVRRDVPLALIDMCIVVPAYLAPLVLRFDGAVPSRFWRSFWAFIPLIVLIHMLSNYLLGLYGQMWRYASVREARSLLFAGALAGAVVIATSILLDEGTRPVPVSVAALGSTLSSIGFGAVRFQSRLFAVRRRSTSGHRTSVLLVGAGDAGSLVLKDILHNRALGLEAVGVVDDDPRKQRLSLHGIPVLGILTDIPAVVAKHGIEQVLLAIPSATGEVVRDVAARCEEAGVMLRVLPSVREVIGGRVTARDIRDLRIEDLLGREQITIDIDAVATILRGRRILITGAGGSIGSEIVRQVAAFEPTRLSLLDHDETHLYDIVGEIADVPGVHASLVDVRDHDRVLSVFAFERPDVVFHTAAHKHVPILEAHPEEAIRTNVQGTANVVDAAVASGVERFVMISTDKAVRPVSVMGTTKWFAEQIVRSGDGQGYRACAVRFGNVLGSRGSVIPTFLRQIGQGGPVTVTDPNMARYFMSIHEAVRLVLQAAAMSRGGEVFTLDMGQPVNILDLARRLIRLSGRVPERDIPIRIVGARPGEKLVEDLVDPSEEQLPSGHPGISVSRPPVPDRAALRRALRELDALAVAGDQDALAARLKALAAEPLIAGGRSWA